MNQDIFKISRNAPPHLFCAGAIYMLTGAVYQRKRIMQPDARKQQWVNTFFEAADIYNWQIIAWVVLPEHYHFLARAPEDSAENLPKFVGSYHKFTARTWNDEDNTPGRKVWWNYWDTCIRICKDYLARFNYIHWNPIKHGLVKKAENYPFSSYRAYLEIHGQDIAELKLTRPVESLNYEFEPPSV